MKPINSTSGRTLALNFKGFLGKAALWGSVSALLVGAVALATTAPTASGRAQAAPKAKTSFISWQPSFEAALAQSGASGKPVMVDFGAKWCGACRIMDEQTYPDAAVIAGSKNFVMVRVDVDERRDLAAHYGISSLPTTVWLHGDGKAIVGAVGALDARDLVFAMHEATKRARTRKTKAT